MGRRARCGAPPGRGRAGGGGGGMGGGERSVEVEDGGGWFGSGWVGTRCTEESCLRCELRADLITHFTLRTSMARTWRFSHLTRWLDTASV